MAADHIAHAAEGMAAESRRSRKARRTVRVHSLRLLLDVVPELLVEFRALPWAGGPDSGGALDQRQPGRSDRRAPRHARGPLQDLSLPHYPQLCEGLSEGSQSG